MLYTKYKSSYSKRLHKRCVHILLLVHTQTSTTVADNHVVKGSLSLERPHTILTTGKRAVPNRELGHIIAMRDSDLDVVALGVDANPVRLPRADVRLDFLENSPVVAGAAENDLAACADAEIVAAVGICALTNIAGAEDNAGVAAVGGGDGHIDSEVLILKVGVEHGLSAKGEARLERVGAGVP